MFYLIVQRNETTEFYIAIKHKTFKQIKAEAMPEDFSSNLASNTTETPTVNRRRRRKRGQEDNNGQGNSNENNGVNKEPISQLEENLLKLGTTISAPVCTFIFYGYQRSVIHLTFLFTWR